MKDKRKRVYNKYKCRCYICRELICFDEMTVDHIIPVFQGGPSTITNLACCCHPCNNKKSVIENYIASRQPLTDKLLSRITEAYSYYKSIVERRGDSQFSRFWLDEVV